MEKPNLKKLEGWENEVYLLLEQDSSIMIKASSEYGDPVELTSSDARNLARLLDEAADTLDNL